MSTISGARVIGTDRHVHAERQKLGQLAEQEVAVAVVQAGAGRTHQRRLAPRQNLDLLGFEPA